MRYKDKIYNLRRELENSTGTQETDRLRKSLKNNKRVFKIFAKNYVNVYGWGDIRNDEKLAGMLLKEFYSSGL